MWRGYLKVARKKTIFFFEKIGGRRRHFQCQHPYVSLIGSLKIFSCYCSTLHPFFFTPFWKFSREINFGFFFRCFFSCFYNIKEKKFIFFFLIFLISHYRLVLHCTTCICIVYFLVKASTMGGERGVLLVILWFFCFGKMMNIVT